MPTKEYTAITVRRRVDEKAKVLAFIVGRTKARVVEDALDYYLEHAVQTPLDAAKASAIVARSQRFNDAGESEPALK